MKLYTTSKSANGIKVVATLHHLDLDAEIVEVDVYTGAGRDPFFLQINPLGKIPAWVDAEGTLTESNAILQYLADAYGGGALWAPAAAGRAKISRWMYWEAAHWQPALTTILTPTVAGRLGLAPPPEGPIPWDRAPFPRMAAHLEAHLRRRSFLVEETLTVADLCVAAMLVYARGTSFPATAYPAIERWYRDISALPAWLRATAGGPWEA